MKEIWEARYAEKEYIYGTKPNNFFKEFIDNNKAGKILLPAEGEGRNAVYAASKGWDVVAFDQSEQAKVKALQLAKENNTKINYLISDIFDFEYQSESFDAIGFIYLHLPTKLKMLAFRKMFKFLKPNGKVLMEVFHKEQLSNLSGGPKIEDLLYDLDEIEEIFYPLNFVKAGKFTVSLDEGKLHQGIAEVIRIEAIK